MFEVKHCHEIYLVAMSDLRFEKMEFVEPSTIQPYARCQKLSLLTHDGGGWDLSNEPSFVKIDASWHTNQQRK